MIHSRPDVGNITRFRKQPFPPDFSARSYDKVRKVARTIADMEGEETIRSHHVAEAVQYRCLDREAR